MSWGTPIERERRNRIRLSVAAYAYEFRHHTIMDDRDFDRIAEGLDRTMDTGHPELDRFFRDEFSPMTGLWIHAHPTLDQIAATYRKVYG